MVLQTIKLQVKRHTTALAYQTIRC